MVGAGRAICIVIGMVPASWKANQSLEAAVMLGTILLVILIIHLQTAEHAA